MLEGEQEEERKREIEKKQKKEKEKLLLQKHEMDAKLFGDSGNSQHIVALVFFGGEGYILDVNCESIINDNMYLYRYLLNYKKT